MNSTVSLQHIYDQLFAHYGPQNWWPADSAFEMIVGAVLTQNTSWLNVEKALEQLRTADALNPSEIARMTPEKLAELIRPAGFFNQKAEYLQIITQFYLHQMDQFADQPLDDFRKALLSLKGVGPETADSILLYACHRPIFVVDAYTRRIFSRLGFIERSASYQQIQKFFHTHLEPDVNLFNEYHALIVIHAKQHCKTKPDCAACPLRIACMSSS